jgi:PilZ domain
MAPHQLCRRKRKGNRSCAKWANQALQTTLSVRYGRQGALSDTGTLMRMATRPQPATLDKRTETRVLCSQLVAVKWTDSEGSAQDCLANLEDISTSGACLQSERPISVKTRVRIAYGGGHLSGTVRYCVYRAVGYFLGIQFDPGTRWTDARFRPEHLTDVREMFNKSVRRSRAAARR